MHWSDSFFISTNSPFPVSECCLYIFPVHVCITKWKELSWLFSPLSQNQQTYPKMKLEWHEQNTYSIRHPFSVLVHKKSNVNHIYISDFLSCFLRDFFYIISSHLIYLLSLFSFFATSITLWYIFACKKILDTVFFAILPFYCCQPIYSNVCSSYRKLQTSNTSLIWKLPILIFAYVICTRVEYLEKVFNLNRQVLFAIH